jgi:hypothetical protein
MGGGRIVSLIERLSNLPTLEDYLKVKEENEGWCVGGGYIIGNEKYKADYITGRDYIPVEALTEYGMDEKQIDECQIQKFERPRKDKKNIYASPHILIRIIIGNQKIPIAYSEKYLAFPFGIIGIHAPKSTEKELYDLYNYLNINNEFLRSYIITTSGRVMIGKATSINKEDIMRIPYSQNEKDVKFSNAEKIIINDIIKNRISDTVQSNINELIDFSDVFCKILNSIYQKEKSFQLFKIIDTGKYYALHFEYTSEKLNPISENVNDIEKYIEAAIPSRKKNQEGMHIQKIMKVYGQDSIILVKPKQLSYWLPSIALRDADETFADYIKSRYHSA